MLSAVFLYVGLSSPGPGRACSRVRNNSIGEITVAEMVRAIHPAMKGVGVRYGCDVELGMLTFNGVDREKVALGFVGSEERGGVALGVVRSDRRCSYPIM
jgi:hypothetical protein